MRKDRRVNCDGASDVESRGVCARTFSPMRQKRAERDDCAVCLCTATLICYDNPSPLFLGLSVIVYFLSRFCLPVRLSSSPFSIIERRMNE